MAIANAASNLIRKAVNRVGNALVRFGSKAGRAAGKAASSAVAETVSKNAAEVVSKAVKETASKAAATGAAQKAAKATAKAASKANLAPLAKDTVEIAGKTVSKKTTARVAARYPKIELYDIGSKELFPKTVRKPLFKPNGELSEEGIALVHMTNYFPGQGSILSSRAKGVGARNSVHTAVNHAVEVVNAGSCMELSWANKKFAVILPFDKTLAENPEGIFLGGTTVDLFSRGSIKLPEGTVIVRQSKRVPKGILRVRNAEDIERFRHLKGIRIVETSELPHSQVKAVLKKMGYEPLENLDKLGGFGQRKLAAKGKLADKSSQYISEELTEEMRTWKKFAEKHGITPTLHSATPDFYIEQMLNPFLYFENMGGMALEPVVNGKSLNIRGILLDNLQSIKAISEKTGLPTNFDTDILEDIIKKAKTFSDIRKGIISRLKMKPDLSLVKLNRGFLNNEQSFLNMLVIQGAIPGQSSQMLYEFINSVPQKIYKFGIMEDFALKEYAPLIKKIQSRCGSLTHYYAASKNRPIIESALKKAVKNGEISQEQMKSIIANIIYH